MRLITAIITANTEINTGVHLIEMHAPQLAQAVQPGQYCLVCCCDTLATDPLLRRPFFVHTVQREHGLCTLLVYMRGRGTAWLVKQQKGAALDILGPMGHGWTVKPSARSLLLVNEGANITALTLLAQYAIEQELTVTLVSQYSSAGDIYPPALLPPEAEYHIITRDGSVGERGEVVDVLGNFLSWADAAYCSVSHETSARLYSRYERLRIKHFAQSLLLRPLVCGSGVCLTCHVETRSGPKLVCRDGPVFDLREIV